MKKKLLIIALILFLHIAFLAIQFYLVPRLREISDSYSFIHLSQGTIWLRDFLSHHIKYHGLISMIDKKVLSIIKEVRLVIETNLVLSLLKWILNHFSGWNAYPNNQELRSKLNKKWYDKCWKIYEKISRFFHSFNLIFV